MRRQTIGWAVVVTITKVIWVVSFRFIQSANNWLPSAQPYVATGTASATTMNFTISFIWIYNNEFIHIFGMRSGIIFLVFICFFSQFGAQFLIWLIGISQQQQSYLSLCDSNLYESQSLHVHIESKPARCNCEWIEKFSHSVCPMVIISETSLTDYLSFTCDVMMFIWYFFFLFLYLFLHVFFFLLFSYMRALREYIVWASGGGNEWRKKKEIYLQWI